MIARLGRNSLWLFVSRLAAQALNVIFTVLLARRLGSLGFGEYTLLAATLFIGNMLTTFGTDMLLMREIAGKRDFSRLPAALLLQLGLSLLCVVLVVAGAPFFPNQSPASVLALRIYSFALFPLAFYTVFTTVLRGMEYMNLYALLGLASIVLQILAVLFLPVGGIVVLATWLLGVQISNTLLAGILCSLRIPGFWQSWHFTRKGVAELMQASAPIAWLSILSMVYQKLGVFMLSAFGGPTLLGWFGASSRALEASKSAHISVFTALYPALARAEPGSDNTFRRMRISLLGGAVLFALILTLFAQPLVLLLFGADFAPSIPVLRILAWMLVPYTINTYYTLAFIAAKQERKVAAALLGSILVLVLLFAGLFPGLGLIGAAWAALAAECTQAGILLAQRGIQVRIPGGEKAHEFSELS